MLDSAEQTILTALAARPGFARVASDLGVGDNARVVLERLELQGLVVRGARTYGGLTWAITRGGMRVVREEGVEG